MNNKSQTFSYTNGLLQGKAYARLHSSLTRTLFPFSLSIPEWKLLGQVHENGKIRLSDLADSLSYDPPMVTKLVKMLEKKELLKRVADESDERAKFILITSSGKNLILKIEPEVKKLMKEILTGITTDEMTIYIKVLNTIVANTKS